MSGDSSARPILPLRARGDDQHDIATASANQQGGFAYSPQQYQQQEMQKNFVFVDEHNRHKRLKVMRACEGCRRRKIKCDAATTNSWPCSACLRLKLHCIRPNGYEGFAEGASIEDAMSQAIQFHQMEPPQDMIKTELVGYDMQASYLPSDAGNYNGFYDNGTAHQNLHFSEVERTQASLPHQNYPGPGAFPSPPSNQSHSQIEPSPEVYTPESHQQPDLSDLLGSLKVNETGTAPYLRNKASFRREEHPAVQEEDEYESKLPPLPSGAGLKIRIPPLLMPDDQTALHYFDLYFEHVHPYVPVLDRAQFYRQWQKSRDAISPLILEAIFAMGGRLADDPSEGQQWLALAARHGDSFMDLPRLSTLQALLMMLKAREAAPKKGYYYRSWMTVVQCVQMGKDLGLDEHHDDHLNGIACGFDPADCQLRTRIWQTVFVCETMVGAPQGRLDLTVDPDSVDFNVPRAINGTDDPEYNVSRNFIFFGRVARSICKVVRAYTKLRKKKDWGLDPVFRQLNTEVHSFLLELPTDLSVSFPPDGSAPWLPSHFIGNMSSYYYLTVLLLHRPQLSFLEPADPQWKRHMMACYDSARALCKLQEAIINIFGLSGLQCMQRGFSFTVYAGLSCIVLHLVAMVSPDPDLNSDAREFFTRHMRIMEKVMENWQMSELRKQVDAVREAFSANIRKPFVLKPSFPYCSPLPSTQSSPHSLNHPSTADRASPGSRQRMDSSGNAPPTSRSGIPGSGSNTISPTTTTHTGSKSPPPSTATSMSMMSQSMPVVNMSQSLTLADGWNPSQLFEQWNTTFGPSEVPSPQDSNPSQFAMGPTSHAAPQQYAAPNIPTFVTPAMWQQSVASVYEGGLKRTWDYDDGSMVKHG